MENPYSSPQSQPSTQAGVTQKKEPVKGVLLISLSILLLLWSLAGIIGWFSHISERMNDPNYPLAMIALKTIVPILFGFMGFRALKAGIYKFKSKPPTA